MFYRFLSLIPIPLLKKNFITVLRKKFQETLLPLLKEEAWERITEQGAERREEIVLFLSWWQSAPDTWLFYLSLFEWGLSWWEIKKVFTLYGYQAKKIVSENPYLLVGTPQIGFKKADHIAKKIIEPFFPLCPQRLRALCGFVLLKNKAAGNTWIAEDTLLQQLCLEGSIRLEDAKKIVAMLSALCEEKKLWYVKRGAKQGYALFHDYESELFVATCIHRLVTIPFEKKISFPPSSSLSLAQQSAAVKITSYQFSCLTGGAGTGKTSIIREVYSIVSQQNKTIILAAPTGKAAQRIKEKTGVAAITLHRLLSFRRVLQAQRESIPVAPIVDAAMIIIDECSLIDLPLWYTLFRSITPYTQVIAVGDPFQLPPVGCGNVFAAIVKKNIPAHAQLHEIFRQEKGGIITAAHAVLTKNIAQFFSATKEGGFFFRSCEDRSNFYRHYHDFLEEYAAKYPAHLFQVITPLQRGETGTEKINEFTQNYFQKKYQREKCVFSKYCIGDKVIQIKNNYQKQVFNGEMGVVLSGDASYGEVAFDSDEEKRIVRYTADEQFQLALAYAITVHKSQGSEFPFLCLPLFMEHFLLLTPALLYTAITRAKTTCVVIGQRKAIYCAMNNKKQLERMTSSDEIMTTLFG